MSGRHSAVRTDGWVSVLLWRTASVAWSVAAFIVIPVPYAF